MVSKSHSAPRKLADLMADLEGCQQELFTVPKKSPPLTESKEMEGLLRAGLLPSPRPERESMRQLMFIQAVRSNLRTIEEQVEVLYDTVADGHIEGFQLVGRGLRRLIVRSVRNQAGARYVTFFEFTPDGRLADSPFPESTSLAKSRDEMILQLYDYIILNPNCWITTFGDTLQY